VPAGYLPPHLFNQIARLGVSSFLELVALRMNNNNVEVLLTKREKDDKFWPGLYHNPGTVFRTYDKCRTFDSLLNRLYEEEYKISTPDAGPFFVGLWFGQTKRSKGFGIVSWMELNSCQQGKFFNVNTLPKELIKGQAAYIKKCAKEFSRFKNGDYQPKLLSETLVH
jgi:hypothetical protein